ncbi:hypothetical protein NEISUBOT_03651 [Neisseria subflava NJ9703]|uniref:Uncharacterized protein n=1 Tax=Neisseria subflava NJ9703 TaxID=546268 RepID=A0A9W5ISA2_NEISU|nr:hypothetical protein NEISUBOT_03651 [Neisseria subflava NJ9703]
MLYYPEILIVDKTRFRSKYNLRRHSPLLKILLLADLYFALGVYRQ